MNTLKDALLGGPGLDGYAFRAAVYCVDCGQDLIRQVFAKTGPLDDVEFRDSEIVPVPIFFGESDTEEHCDQCGEYLYGESEDETEEG